MPLHFANLDVLKLAVTSGTAPEEVCAGPVRAALGPAGDVWLQPQSKLSRGVLAQLARLGVENVRSAPVPLGESLACWLQLFPLTEPGPLALSDRTPVLFDLPQAEMLPEVAAEVLRLGNDRQSFCYATCGDRVRALLRVVGPPYYSLLRALERDGRSDCPVAYVEQRPRVWVEIGRTHPLVDRIVPPAGQILLIRAPRLWQFVEECPFQDVYRSLQCELPRAAAAWRPVEREQRIRVPLRLTPGGTEPAELWVLGDSGEEQLDALVGAADNALLARLAFAVGECDGRRVVVLRARPSKQAPPVLVLDAVAFRPYLKLPNLFVPCGQRLHPPLRRNAVAELLAADGSRITWLQPAESGRFTPQSLPDAAFRPLADWVEYVLDREHEAMAEWIDAHRFDFEPFVCREDRRPAEPKPEPPKAEPARPQPPPQKPRQEVETPKPGEPENGLFAAVETSSWPTVEDAGEHPRDAVQRRLFELERQFLASESPLDGDDRAALWCEMGHANAALGYFQDAAVCWASSGWDRDAWPPGTLAAWLESARKNAGLSASAERLDSMLAEAEVLPDRAAAVASYVACAARLEQPPPALTANAGAIGRYLERYEPLLPARTTWLAWTALYRISGGDVLALARARDRMLERLYQHGLRPDLDLPSFLRSRGAGDSQQARAIRERVGRLQQWVVDWIEEPAFQNTPRTKQYAALMFAYALARLGESTGCQVLVEEARDALVQGDPLHRWVWDAFSERIRQALDGRPSRDRLSPELLARVEQMERLDRYKLDRLRQNSRILEPSEKIDPYRNWRRYASDFQREVNALVDLADREQLRASIARLFGETGTGSERVQRESFLLAVALELAPRLGEEYAAGLLDRVAPLLDRGVELDAGLRVLEKALFVAAHFDLSDRLDLFLSRIYDLLQQQRLDRATASLEQMLSECIRGLRRLGMRDEIGRLLARLSAMVQAAEADAQVKPDDFRHARLRLLLLVASGWLFFGQQADATPVLDDARSLLRSETLKPAERSELAQAYVAALSYAPVEFALPRIEELFAPARGEGAGRRLPRIVDSMTTTTHFSLFQLKIVEAIVLALVGEEFTDGAENRRWLDEDEFLVRRRIHRDVRAALGQRH